MISIFTIGLFVNMFATACPKISLLHLCHNSWWQAAEILTGEREGEERRREGERGREGETEKERERKIAFAFYVSASKVTQ